MATPISTEKSAAPVNPADPAALQASTSDDLEFPVEPGFRSHLPRASLEAVLELSYYYMPMLQANPDYWTRRAEDGCPVEFDLEHPERCAPTYPADLIDDIFSALPFRQPTS